MKEKILEFLKQGKIKFKSKDDMILLQNRVKKDWRGYTLPGGHIEPGESFVDAVIREMKEEIGFGAKNIIPLKKEMTLAPGMLMLKMHTFLCTELYESRLEGDEPEPISIIKVSTKEAKDLIFDYDSPLTESRAIAALTLALHKLNAI